MDLQDWGPDLVVYDMPVPIGALVADAIHVPKVGISVVSAAPMALLPAGLHLLSYASLMPMCPYWMPQPMVTRPCIFVLLDFTSCMPVTSEIVCMQGLSLCCAMPAGDASQS